MTDLERFFRRLVENLAAADPACLHRPLPLADIQRDILPYRANRRALALDSSEEYEMVLLRLSAGERGLVRTEPEEARARFARELESPNPDLGVLQEFENVLLTLRAEPLARALGPEPSAGAAYAPPVRVPDAGLPELEDSDELPEPTDDIGSPELARPDEPATADDTVQCLYCGGVLPPRRSVNFCPHCGQSQVSPTCSRCHGDLEPGWKHCVNCGAPVSSD